jgi:hypothetical protein
LVSWLTFVQLGGCLDVCFVAYLAGRMTGCPDVSLVVSLAGWQDDCLCDWYVQRVKENTALHFFEKCTKSACKCLTKPSESDERMWHSYEEEKSDEAIPAL